MNQHEGALVAGRFQLVEQLSEGAMGTIWRANHVGLDIACAVKFIHARLFDDADLKVRFEREAKTAASIRSPNVVQMLDYGIWDDTPYMVMELLEGEDLAKRLDRRRILGAVETIAILAQVGRALAKAHAAGLVHRDLKPENIFLARDDDRELVKVLDFGIVRVDTIATNKRVTRQGVMLGTPSYMSPEQALGQRDLDLRSDLWALAVVAYECLTGELPFVGEKVLDVAMSIVSGPIPTPPASAVLPPAFEAWWRKAVARDREARFASAHAQIEALAAAFSLPKRSLLPHGQFSARPTQRRPLPLATTCPSPAPSLLTSGISRLRTTLRTRPDWTRWKLLAAVSAAAVVGTTLLVAATALGQRHSVGQADGRGASEAVAMVETLVLPAAAPEPQPAALPAPEPGVEAPVASTVPSTSAAPP